MMLRTSKLYSLRNCSNVSKLFSKNTHLTNVYASQRSIHFLRNKHSSLSLCNNSHNNSTYTHQKQNTQQSNIFILSRKHFANLPDHEVVPLPALSPSVETSKIVEWKKKEGDFIEANEAIAVVQTDKAELDWQLTDDAYLAKILLAPGETVPVGTPACIFVDDESSISAFANYDASSAGSSGASDSSSSSSSSSSSEQQSATQSQSSGGGGGGGSSLPSNLPEFKVEGLPALSPTATDGAIVEWLVKEGDMVEEGSGIAEIQTDKSTVTWSATDEAYVAKLLYPVDSESRLPVGTPLAVFVDSKDDVSAFASIDNNAFISGGDSSSTQSSAPPSKEKAAPTSSKQQGESSSHGGRIPSIQFRYGVREPAATPSSQGQQKQTSKSVSKKDRVFASPYARQIANELNVDLTLIDGSGPRGRVIASDVEKAAKEQKSTSKSGAGAAASKSTGTITQAVSFESDRSFEDIPVSMMREVIAKRLSESKFTSPHYYVTFDFELDNLMRMRADMNEGEDSKISINDFIVKACALALRQVPMANVSWHGKYMRRYNYVDISVAVATPTGLITPIVKDADMKGLRAISSEIKDLAKRAKDNKLAPHEFQGGTFTISNLGMFGVKSFTAIINPPQSCILAVGGGVQTLKPDANSEKGFKTVTTMTATISSDHRSVDGALAAQYMSALKTFIEHPAKMML